MKKVYFMAFIATAALTMMSCSNDDITTSGGVSKDEATAINFSTYLGRTAQTRGAETTTSSIQTSGFGVFASYTGTKDFTTSSSTPNFMYNQQVTYSNGWTYNPVKYWPNAEDDKVSFFAYAPYSSNDENDNVKFDAVGSMKGTPKLKVTVPTDLTNSVDLVAASVLNQTKPADPSTTPVKYELQHEMTRLTMQAKVSEEVYKTDNAHNKTFVVVKSIVFGSPQDSKIYNSGTYTFSTTSTKDTDSGVNRGTWSDQKGGANISFYDILNTKQVTASTAAEGTTYKTGQYGVKLTSNNAVSLFRENHYAYLIPVDGGLDENKENVTIVYDVVTEDVALADGYSCTSASKTINLPAGLLKVGTSYTLTFEINVNEVKLSAEAANWDIDSTNGTVSVPASGSDTTL